MLSSLTLDGACEGSQKETAIRLSAFRISTMAGKAIVDRILTGERADLPVQALTKVSLSLVSGLVARPPQ
jgi:hypothetical protein